MIFSYTINEILSKRVESKNDSLKKLNSYMLLSLASVSSANLIKPDIDQLQGNISSGPSVKSVEKRMLEAFVSICLRDRNETDPYSIVLSKSLRILSFRHLIKWILGYSLLQFLVISLSMLLSKNDFIHNPGLYQEECKNRDYLYTSWAFRELVLLLFLTGIVLLRKIKDALFIRSELTVVIVISYLRRIVYYTAVYVPSVGLEEPILRVSFVCITILVTFFLPSVYCILRQRADRKILLKFDYQCFERIIREPETWLMFKSQVVKDLSMENCLFYEEYMHLKTLSIFEGFDRNTILTGTIKHSFNDLYLTYIKSGAEYELNLSSYYKEIMAAAAKKEEFTISLFDSISNEVKDMMYKNNFPRFIQNSDKVLVIKNTTTADLSQYSRTS